MLKSWSWKTGQKDTNKPGIVEKQLNNGEIELNNFIRNTA